MRGTDLAGVPGLAGILTPAQCRQTAQSIASVQLSSGEIPWSLAGHTDNQGDQKLNLNLSEQRVMSVKQYLVTKGISEKRISGKGYGSSKPIADNSKEETRRLNRRVEFTITKK